MNTVFEEIYAEAFTNQLVKIAQDNNLDPGAFVDHVMEKQAGVKAMYDVAKAFAKTQAGTVQQSFKNLIDAGAGLGNAAKATAGPYMKHGRTIGKKYFKQEQKSGIQQFKDKIVGAKAAGGIIGGGTLAVGGGAYGLTR